MEVARLRILDKFQSCDQLRCLLFVVVEVPKTNLVARSDDQLVVLVVQVDLLVRVRLELEEQFL